VEGLGLVAPTPLGAGLTELARAATTRGPTVVARQRGAAGPIHHLCTAGLGARTHLRGLSRSRRL
jgi:hypothetical protein